MAIGQLLAGAGVVGQGWRQEEDAQRASREFVEETRRAREKFGMGVVAEQQAARRRDQEYAFAGTAEQRASNTEQRTAEQFTWTRNLYARQLAELQRADAERRNIANLPQVTAGGAPPQVNTGGAPFTSMPVVPMTGAPMTGAPRVSAPTAFAPTAYTPPAAPVAAPSYVGPTGYTSPSPVAPMTPGLNFGTPSIAPPAQGAPLPMRNIPPPPPVAQAFPIEAPSAAPTFPTTGQLFPVPPTPPTPPQNVSDRQAVVGAGTRVLDTALAPSIALQNILRGGANVFTGTAARGLGMLTGKDVPNTLALPYQSFTPSYDKYVGQEQARIEAEASSAQRGQIPPTPRLPDSQQLLGAMSTVESGGDPNAVSRKGALGLMQVMPATAMKPGFNIPNIFEFAKQNGVEVGRENESEAKRLLQIPSLGASYGMRIMDTMLQRYNGNLPYALAAYNAGPGRIDKWLADGADPKKLPKETQDYVPKVLAQLNKQAGAPAPGAAPAPGTATPAPAPGTTSGTPALGATAPAPAPDATPVTSILNAPAPTAQQMKKASDFYLVTDPTAIPFEAQQLQTNSQQQLNLLYQQRQSTARLADVYRQSGNAVKFAEFQGLVFEQDQKILTARQAVEQQMNYLQGMQGIQEFSTANDPRRLAAVWSQYAGVPIGIQPRSDGAYDILVNGKLTKENQSMDAVMDSAQLAFNGSYRAQKGAASAAQNVAVSKAQLDIMVENAKTQGMMFKEVFVEQAKGNIQARLEAIKQRGYTVTGSSAGDNMFIFTAKDGSGAYLFNASGRTEVIDGVKIPSYSAFPVPGLPSLRPR